ncbi:hypothetical protein ABW21_db0207851 [Orbilia brochopaga]|nr:hypothetical protein ABW21_db0207851 [Drechslerella brochopaga]
MTETMASTAAAAAAIRGLSANSGFGPIESRKLSLFPATPGRVRSVPNSRASSIRIPRTPTRAHELRSIQEDPYDDGSTATSAMPISLAPNNLYRRHSTITTSRPTIGMARSPSTNLGRRNSQSYLRRTQSLYTPGAARSVYSEQAFRVEEKAAFLPASSRSGNTAPPMLRTLRDPDALGTKRATGYARRFPFSLRFHMFDKARSLRYRMSRTLWWSKASVVPMPVSPMPVQRVHAATKHYGDPPYRPRTAYLDPEETQTQYDETVIHHRVWENQSYITTLDNQGPDYFTVPPVLDGQIVAASSPVRIGPEKESRQQRGFTPFHAPADLNGVDSRRVYSALMKKLSKRFSSEGPLPEVIPEEEPEEPRPSRASNENVRPFKLSMDSSGRLPLLEIPNFNTLLIEEDEEEVTQQQQEQTPNASNAMKRIRSDDALFSQIATPHQVWRDEEADDTAANDVATGLRHLSIANVDTPGAATVMIDIPAKLSLPQDNHAATATPDPQSFGVSLTHFRTASGKLQENTMKGEIDTEDGMTNSQRGRARDPAFL